MSEHEHEEIRWLIDEVGFTKEQVRLLSEDDDLWMVSKEDRFEDIHGEEAVQKWEDAVQKAKGLEEAAFSAFEDGVGNPFFAMAAHDMLLRMEAALRRAKERFEAASQ